MDCYNNISVWQGYTNQTGYVLGKTSEWSMKSGCSDCNIYIRQQGRYNLAKELRTDPLFQQIIVPYVQSYAQGQEQDAIVSLIRGAINPEQDVLNILAGSFLDAIGHKSTGEKLVEIGVAGLVLAIAIAVLKSK